MIVCVRLYVMRVVVVFTCGTVCVACCVVSVFCCVCMIVELCMFYVIRWLCVLQCPLFVACV